VDDDPAEMIAALIEARSEGRYGLSDINQREHALQAAWLAERSGCDTALIVGALPHDIGHMVHGLGENPAAAIDDRHEPDTTSSGITSPRRQRSRSVSMLRRNDTCAPQHRITLPRLSPDSILSLSLQGGPTNEQAVEAFAALRHARAAVELRRFDEAAKLKDLVTPTVGHFLAYPRKCPGERPGLRPGPWS
jgi:predicted HD phosphohydrolase